MDKFSNCLVLAIVCCDYHRKTWNFLHNLRKWLIYFKFSMQLSTHSLFIFSIFIQIWIPFKLKNFMQCDIYLRLTPYSLLYVFFLLSDCINTAFLTYKTVLVFVQHYKVIRSVLMLLLHICIYLTSHIGDIL